MLEKRKVETSKKPIKKESKNKTIKEKEKNLKIEKISKEKKSNKKEKKQENILEENIGDSIRKWNDYKNKDSKKGAFKPEEIKKIKDAVCEYAFENKLNEQDLINLVTEKQSKKDRNIWPKISECLPERTVQSIHNFCHRSLNPYNYKGNWSDEEVNNLIK